jgi:hypothetical protein
MSRRQATRGGLLVQAVRRAKIAASKRGKPRPPHVRAVLLKNLAKGRTPEAWQKVGAAHRKRGTRPPKAGPAWPPEHDALLDRLPPAEVARRTGRSLRAVYDRRSELGLTDGRRRRWLGS